MRYKLQIQYDGTPFCGWQIQPNRKSVQGEITAAAKSLTGEDINLVGCGRTDTGVHALNQAAHFDLTKPFELKKLAAGLNFYLPPAIRIVKAEAAEDNFNARFDAKRKTYTYLMYEAEADNPLLQNRALRINGLDIKAMRAAAGEFVGIHDFLPFMSSGSDVKTTVREIFSCRFFKKWEFYTLEITANGFLYNMVRKIVGFLIAIGQGKRNKEEILQILGGSGFVKEIAPPYGLYLKDVQY
ncbi:MAG: tRNA pseudouridine(38-40) synthase TruA [Firmicutes bacterium]|nr:tRNA pseudouridine(38-40) synthase TruA [Bacillota bacterium]